MAIPTFTPGYPPDNSSLGQTKSTVRNNLDGTFQTLNIDHVNNNGQPGSQPAGYHTIIHEVSQTNVTTVANYNQIFSGVPGTLIVNGVTTRAFPAGGDTQLYSLSGTGILSQLTGQNIATPGYLIIGRILIQWGSFANDPSGSNPITFSPPFSADPYFAIANSTAPLATFKSFIKVINQSATGATVTLGVQSGGGLDPGAQTVQWLAIGPF